MSGTRDEAKPFDAYEFWVSIGKPQPINTVFAEAYANYRGKFERAAGERAGLERAAEIAKERIECNELCETCITAEGIYKAIRRALAVEGEQK